MKMADNNRLTAACFAVALFVLSQSAACGDYPVSGTDGKTAGRVETDQSSAEAGDVIDTSPAVIPYSLNAMIPYSLAVTCPGTGETNCCSSDAICFYVSDVGNVYNSGENNGQSEALAVNGIDEAQKAIVGYIAENGPITTNVEVRIKMANYSQPRMVIWTTVWPDKEVRFMPTDHKFGNWGSFSGRPVFDGTEVNGQRSGESWFELRTWNSNYGANSNLHFYYIEVKNYGTSGLVFHGHSSKLSRWNGNNYVYGMYIHDIGELGPDGYAGIHIVNSRNNQIRNNHLIDLTNFGGASNGAHMHATYLAHGASNNLIRDNNIVRVSGTPFRVRNGSNDNDFRANILTDTGSIAQYDDWHQDDYTVGPGIIDCKPAANRTQECPSWRNWYRYNTSNCLYTKSKATPLFYFHPDNTTENRLCVPTGCTTPLHWVDDNGDGIEDSNEWYVDDKLATASNTYSCSSSAKVLVDVAGARRWSDGSYARSCYEYRRPPAGYMYAGEDGSGVYTVEPSGPGSATGPFDVFCDQTHHGGGWTLLDNDSSIASRITRRIPGAITNQAMTGGRYLPDFHWSPTPQVRVYSSVAAGGPYVIMRPTGFYALQYPTGTTATGSHSGQWAYDFQNGNPTAGTQSWTYNGSGGHIGTLWVGNSSNPNMACGYQKKLAGLGGVYQDYSTSTCSSWAR